MSDLETLEKVVVAALDERELEFSRPRPEVFVVTLPGEAKLTTTASGMLSTKPSAATGESGSAMSKSSSPTTVGARPRVRKWYAARPRSLARYHPTRSTGR